MGIQKRENTNNVGITYLKINAKHGRFQQGSKSKGDYVEHPAGEVELTGRVISFKIEQETYEGKPSGESMLLVMRDPEPGQPNMGVSFSIANAENDASGFAVRLIARLLSADLSKPVTLTPWFIAAGTKIGDTTFDMDTSGVTVHQDNVKLVEDFGVDAAGNKITQLPRAKVTKGMVGNKEVEVKDKTELNELLDSLLARFQTRFSPAPSEGTPSADHSHDDDEAASAAQSAVDGSAPRQR